MSAGHDSLAIRLASHPENHQTILLRAVGSSHPKKQALNMCSENQFKFDYALNIGFETPEKFRLGSEPTKNLSYQKKTKVLGSETPENLTCQKKTGFWALKPPKI